MHKIIASIIVALASIGLCLPIVLLAQQAESPAAALPAAVPADGGSNAGLSAALPAVPPGTVQIDPIRQQIVGIRSARVEKKPLAHTIRLLGRVAADETRVFYINATVDGWITKTLPNTTGSMVKKDETLATFYSSEFLSAGQALLFALRSMDRLHPTGKEPDFQKDQIAQFEVNLQQYKDSLRNLGMGELQINEMIRTRRYMENISITSPADGFILSRKVSPGLRFEKGWEFYRIADLSRVWVLADVYKQEAAAFRPGVAARIMLPYQQQISAGRVSNVLPVFDPDTRTLKVRLETENPGFALRPDMFVDVELPVEYPAAVAVPIDAVLDSGLKKTVFVSLGNGIFEPREVQTGRRMAGQVEITSGLNEGEQIVVSGNFLVDSESNLSLAASGMLPALEKDPVCGQEVFPNKAAKLGRKAVYNGRTYYFESDECRRKFIMEPDRYLKK